MSQDVFLSTFVQAYKTMNEIQLSKTPQDGLQKWEVFIHRGVVRK